MTSSPDTASVVAELLSRHGRTFASEAGIRLDRNTPAPLFQLLVLSLLASARIDAGSAMDAARALFSDGLTTPDEMARASWEHRTKVLNEAGYARYDESTSRYLEDTARRLLDQHEGDLRTLRQDADGDVDALRAGLTTFKGIGDVGAATFLREVQLVWDEVTPFVDDRAARGARALGLPEDPHDLASLVPEGRHLAELVAALVRSSLAEDDDEIVEAAT